MPQFRPAPRSPDRTGAAETIGRQVAGRRVPTGIKDLIADAGGTRAAAAATGKSQRTMQRWARGDITAIPAAARGSLARAGQTARTGQLIQALGGPHAVAQMTGRSVRTVQRWATGQIRAPRADARQQLGRADVALQLTRKGVAVDPATGIVAQPTYLRLTGDIRIRGRTSSPPADPNPKKVGEWGGLEIQPQTMLTIIDALGRGDVRHAHTALEEYLSTNYANCDGYYPDQGVGLFIDRIDSIEFNQDPQ